MRKFLLVVFVFFSGLNAFAQVDLGVKEKELASNFELLLKADTDSLKLSICGDIEDQFLELLSNEESFVYPFSGLANMGKLTSPDELLRIFNWNCVLSDGTYRYFGILQIKEKKAIRVEKLVDSTADTDMMKQYSISNWGGALYYQIIPIKQKGSRSYFLLGWDGNNYQTSKKLIEILNIDSEGKLSFGSPVILWRGKVLNRVVFEYAKQARMTIQYEEKAKRFVFDHLAPSKPMYQNQFEYYGPDFSYDALEYRKGKWVLVENVDVRNK